jgi:two-component system sensor histidine kinase UhpB
MFAKSKDLPFAANYPLRVFALVMFVIFAVEGAIMLAFPVLPAWTRAPVVDGFLDASVLTLVTGPAVWWLAVAPVRRLLEARGELLHKMFRAQDEERARIARDLHDEIGQHLTALLVGLKTIESVPDLETAKVRARELRDLGAAAHEEVRRLARGLRPGVLEELGLEAAVCRMAEDFERMHETTVRVDVLPGACDGLSVAAETSLYRSLQEALTNAARHAEAEEIDIRLQRAGNSITLTVVDHGRGFRLDDPEESVGSADSLGLASIRERALMLGGQCTIRSELGRGTTVQVSIPVRGRHDGEDSRIHRG